MPRHSAFPVIPQTQARSSTTFRPPPLDDCLSLPELFEWNGVNNSMHPLFVCARGDGRIRTIPWSEVVAAMNVGSQIIRDRLGWTSGTARDVIAIIAPSDNIPYCINELSIMRAGYVVFPISPRNSAAAVAHLVEHAHVQHILVGREQSMVHLVQEALAMIRERGVSSPLPSVSSLLSYDELFSFDAERPPQRDWVAYNDEGTNPEAHTLILHSSGSTAFPKPIIFTNRRLAEVCLIPYFGKRDLTGKIISVHVLPMFHAMGFQMICWAASCGMVLSAFEPGVPIALATPEGHFEAARASGSDIICSLPAVLEAWSRNQEAVNWLAGRDGALYSGGPLNPHVGEYLRSQGVDIAVVYGSTEVGALTPIVPEKGNHDWDYFELSSFLHTRMVPSGDNAYEIVVIANEFCHPCVINTQVDGHDAYATSDLLVPHSTTPGLWKVYGRTDEQIIHSTGEKTNPGPLESILNQDPHIASCVMFGRGQFQAGVLVDPVLDHRPLPLDERQLAEFRDKIWPTVTQMNAFAPQHSRLFKEMIMVTDLAKPFTYTAKGTPRRQPVLRDYSQEIERLYEIVHDSTQSDIPAPLTWDLLSTTDFVRRVVGRVLVHAVGDTDDFFQNGCDSLQATWIRNSILRGLRDSAKLETREITRDFVYEHPTVVALSVYVSGLAAGSTNDTDTSEQARVAAMRAMARAYSEAFPRHQPGTGRSHHDTHADKSVFLLTGTTGSFGCHILHRLVSDPHVSRVFALNRPSKDGISLRERQNAALIERGLPTDVLGDKAILLEVDLAAQQFGTSGTLYEEMRNSVTHIVHNAWRVDFNVSLTSFESNIKGLRGLVDFALSSGMHQPPRLTFMSSIGVLRDVRADSSHEEGHIEPEVAAGSGYSESKWVAEEMLYRARKETSLQTLSVRVGQLCGGIDGSWNSNEWFPALVQSAEILRCFPRDDRTVDWIPLDVAATAVAEFCTTTSPVGFLHLVHPRPVPWDSIAAVVAAELRVGLIAFDVWLAKLEQKGNTATTHPGCDEVEMLRTLPALRLLPFFKTIIKPGAIGSQDLAMTNAMGASPSLSDPNVRQVGEDDVRKWIAYWRRVGLLSNSGR